jgi:hypothetical protein
LLTFLEGYDFLTGYMIHDEVYQKQRLSRNPTPIDLLLMDGTSLMLLSD